MTLKGNMIELSRAEITNPGMTLQPKSYPTDLWQTKKSTRQRSLSTRSDNTQASTNSEALYILLNKHFPDTKKQLKRVRIKIINEDRDTG